MPIETEWLDRYVCLVLCEECMDGGEGPESH